MKLWQQAKKQGNWDPRDQRLDRDLEDWKSLQQPERDVILWLVAMFQLGKQSLLPAIMPLISIHAAEGRLEETVYLTSLLAEEARHLEMFHRFLDEVASDATDLARLRGPGLSRFLDAELPATTERLSSDVSPESQARAWVTCNLIIDGVLAQTGYRAFHEIIERTGIMPGMQRAIQYVKGDEARHLAWGTWVLARLSAEHGAAVQPAIRVQVDELAEPALAVVNDILATQPALPFGLTVEHFAEIAATQFRRRITRLETLQAMPLESLLRSSPDE
jgi:ribonucleoside-diphosphate reductase beta chain